MDLGDITIHIYLEMLVEFVFEFYVISALVSFKLEKRKHFWWKYIIGLLIILAVAYPLAIAYASVGNTVIGRSLTYLCLFLLALYHHILCYKEELLRNILLCDITYLTQNALYKIIAIFFSIMNYTGGFGIGGPSAIAYKMTYYLVWAALVVGTYFLYIRKVKDYTNKLMLPEVTIFISVTTILVSIFICSVFDIHFEIISQILPASVSLSGLYVSIANDLLTLLLDFSVVIMFFAYMRRLKLSDSMVKMKYVLRQSEQQYKITQDTIETINIKCHDMRHKINKIVGDNLSKETLDEVNETISIYDTLIDTGSKTVDTILIEKSLICDKYGISFTKLVDGKSVNFLSTGDLFCLFGNILDNAIDATKSLKDEKKRYINLSVRKLGEGIAEVECSNYYQSEIDFDNGLPKTSNEDKANHGFGVKSIRNIVSKYLGHMNIEAKNNVFTIRIIIYNNIPVE